MTNNARTSFAILVIVLTVALFPKNVGKIAAQVAKGFQAEMARD